MASTINVNGSASGLTLCHRASDGVASATIPDVCKTPSPGGPVPVPYPNVAMSRDLAKGTTTVSADGGNMCANYGSEFSRSTGDEPGTAGGVKSSTFTKEATWITYSFDVKLEGKGACRLSDKMFMNHGNTVCANGVLQPPQFTPPSDPNCARLYEEIFRLVWGQRQPNPGGGFPQGTKGLAWRWKEMAENAGRWTPTQNATHMDEYVKQRDALRDRLNQWRNKKKRNCNDDDLPPGTPEYASDQVPELGPGKPTVPSPNTSQFREHLKSLGLAVAGATTVVVVLIVVSRLIRLFPPLWPLQASPI
jgi:hypothetical protein